MGRANMTNFLLHPDVEIAAVCDVYEPNLAKGFRVTGGRQKLIRISARFWIVKISTRSSWPPRTIGTRYRWSWPAKRARTSMRRSQLRPSLEEGKRMVEAARKYNRVVQVNTWYRSSIHYQKGVQLIQDGLIGKVSFVRLWNYLNFYPEGIGSYQDSEPPADLDWDMWLGPAPKVPFNWRRFGVKFPGPPSAISGTMRADG